VLDRLDDLETRAPWLLVLTSSSSHLPYTHPGDGPDEAPAVWDWVQARLLEFHEADYAISVCIQGLQAIWAAAIIIGGQ